MWFKFVNFLGFAYFELLILDIHVLQLQNEKEKNDALRVENEKLYVENQTLKGMIMDPFCTKCHNRLTEKETKKLHLQALSAENANLKKEVHPTLIVFKN